MIKSFILSLLEWTQMIVTFLKTFFTTSIDVRFENIALRSQLSIYQQKELNNKTTKTKVSNAFRQLWVLLSKFFPKWKESLVIVKPETVVRWHKTAFKVYWRKKSKITGRPQISSSTIALIKRIHKENPLLSPQKIWEKLFSLNISDAPCTKTIAKYITKNRKSPSDKQIQSWKTFLKNHCKDIWAMDFFVVPTLTFKVLYVFIIISHDRRKIEHFAVTSNPNSDWVCQQIRNATPFGEIPKYLVHDNDSIFTSKEFKDFFKNTNIKSKRTGFQSPWQNGICERLVGIIRQELLNHLIPLNEKHLTKLLKEYVEKYYNPERTHQGIGCETPTIKDKPIATTVTDTVLYSQPLLGGLYHSYKKVA